VKLDIQNICLLMTRDSQNMHGKSPNMRIYMHRKSPKYAPKYAKFAKICICMFWLSLLRTFNSRDL